MSDDLVKRLKDRLNALYDDPREYSPGQIAEASGLALARIEELEAKLAMAVETLQTIDDVIDARSELFTSDRDLRDNVQDRIRIVIAELKGQSDE